MKFYVATELYLNEVRAFHDALTHHYKPMVTQFLKDWGVKNKEFKYSSNDGSIYPNLDGTEEGIKVSKSGTLCGKCKASKDFASRLSVLPIKFPKPNPSNHATVEQSPVRSYIYYNKLYTVSPNELDSKYFMSITEDEFKSVYKKAKVV